MNYTLDICVELRNATHLHTAPPHSRPLPTPLPPSTRGSLSRNTDTLSRAVCQRHTGGWHYVTNLDREICHTRADIAQRQAPTAIRVIVGDYPHCGRLYHRQNYPDLRVLRRPMFSAQAACAVLCHQRVGASPAIFAAINCCVSPSPDVSHRKARTIGLRRAPPANHDAVLLLSRPQRCGARTPRPCGRGLR